jgi:hypothetical protein
MERKVQDSLQQLSLQWRQNPRLRVGVLLVCVILAGYGVLLLGDYRDQLQEGTTSQGLRLQKMQTLGKQAYWPERAEQARAQLIRFEALLWKAESKGLAQATLLSWFNRELGRIDLQDLEVDTELAHEVPGGKGIWQVTANLDGVVDRAQLVKLLGLLELHDQLITLEQVKISRVRTGFRLQLQLRAWFQGASPPPDAEASR